MGSPSLAEIEKILTPVVEEVKHLQASNELLRQEVLRLCGIVSSLQITPEPERLLTSAECAELLGRSRCTLSRYKNEFWLEGVHYFSQGPGRLDPVMYCQEAVQHWQSHRSDPPAHQRFCEQKIRERQAA